MMTGMIIVSDEKNYIDDNLDDSTGKLGAQGLKSIMSRIFPKTISDLIGRDSEAQNSVVWLVISKTLNWSWWVCLILIINDIIRNDGKNAIDITKSIFDIFIPIITLALGYLFGKKKSEDRQ